MGLTYIPPRRNQFQNQMFNMLSQMAFQKMNHKQRMELADREIKLYDTRIKEKQAYEKAKLEEERKYEAGKDSEERESKLLEKGFTVFPAKTATTTPTAAGINQKANKNIFFDKATGKVWIRPPEKEGPLVKQYRLAKKEGFKGNFVDFKKTTRPSTTINVGEKLDLHRKKKEIDAATSIKKFIADPRFKSTVVKGLKEQYGNQWEYQEQYMKEELIIQEMHRQISAANPDKTVAYDEKRGGWVDAKTGKMIKKYKPQSEQHVTGGGF